MIRLWNKIGLLGVRKNHPAHARYVVISNHIAAFLIVLGFFLAILFSTYFSDAQSPQFILISSALILPVWILNYYGHHNFSRYYLSIIIPLLPIAVSVLAKVYGDDIILESQYYDSRLILLSTCLLPLIIFDYTEKRKLVSSLIFCFLLIILFDPIHSLFHVGFYQHNGYSSGYALINYIIIIVYVFIVAGFIVLKAIITKTHKKNRNLILNLHHRKNDLIDKNEKLLALNQKIEEHSKSIKLQAQEIAKKQEELIEANRVIEDQKDELLAKNRILEMKLHKQDRNLLQINTELVKRNNELRQFGYTISHNLRGPIASLLGLVNLFEKDKALPTNREVIEHMHFMVDNLDIVIRDLNKVVELRNDLVVQREYINLDSECNIVRSLLGDELTKSQADLKLILHEKNVYAVKAYVQSALYNLISNSIKFRSPERSLKIHVISEKEKGQIKIQVKDNGLGFDVQRHIHDLFVFYKRFHTHIPGKGFGLYLTKLQVESMGGSIKVNSYPDQGTTFTLLLPENPDEISY